MNPRTRNLTLAASTLVVLAVATLLLMQQQTLSGLRTREFALQTAIQSERPAAPASAEPASPATPTTNNSTEALTDAERMELLRLRGEVTALNQRLGELSSVEQRHEALKAQLDQARANPGSMEAVVPAGYILRTKARNVGRATPEAALETFLWACEHRDQKTLLNTISTEKPELLRVLQDPAKLQEMWEEFSKVPGLQPVGKTTQPDGSVAMQVAVLPGNTNDLMSSEPVVARLINGQWKLEFR